MRKRKQDAWRNNSSGTGSGAIHDGGPDGRMLSFSETGVSRTLHENGKDPTVHPESPRNNPSLH